MPNGSSSSDVNFRVARRLEEVAHILETQGANPYRVQAYRRAADTIRRLPIPAGEILRQEGEPGLRKLPGIGERLARSIATLLITGRLPMLNRLRGQSDANALLTSVPGIGKKSAARLRRDLGINTLEQLESAAHDGRLTEFGGIGAKKLAGIVDSLSARLGRVRPVRASDNNSEPNVAEILDVDREYRDQAAAGALPTIAPRRFNPKREAWLPILHAQRGDRHYMALFSNTARAHQMAKTRDWVVIYYDGRYGEHQCTAITSQRGPLTGERIVRGREGECLEFYQRAEQPVTAPATSSEAHQDSAPLLAVAGR